MNDNELATPELVKAVADVVEAAVAWAAVDYGDAAQLHADALLADAVRDYVRAQAMAPSTSFAQSTRRPNRIDV